MTLRTTCKAHYTLKSTWWNTTFKVFPHVLAQEVSDVVPSRSTSYYKIGGVFYVNVGVRNRIRGRLSTESSDQRQTEAEMGSDDKVTV